jgi:hypothetical protein
LSKAVANNHGIKAQAILMNDPKVVRKSHVNLVKEMEEKGDKLDKSLSTQIQNAYQEKQGNKNSMKV